MRVLREAQALVEAGYGVVLFCCQSPNQANRLPDQERIDGIEVYRIFPKRLYKYHGKSLRLLKSFFKLVFQARGQSFDVIHAHDANMLPLGYLLSQYWRIPLVYDSHEYWQSLFKEEEERLKDLPNQKERLKKLMQLSQMKHFEKQVIPKCRAVITVSDGISQKIQQNQIKPPPVTVIRNTPNRLTDLDGTVKLKSLHQLAGLSKAYPILLYQGQIAEKRGTKLLINEWLGLLKTLDKEHPAWQFRLVLMGPVLPNDEALFNEITHPMPDKLMPDTLAFEMIRYVPPVPATELVAITQDAVLGIHPILNTSENHYLCLPNKLFEYIQAGIPVAVSHFPEMQGVVDSFGIGLTFDPHQSGRLGDALKQFIEGFHQYQNEPYHLPLQNAQAELCWEKESQKLIALYHSIF
jgi:glycosyltransferase involved in cell wall biosynthesis